MSFPRSPSACALLLAAIVSAALPGSLAAPGRATAQPVTAAYLPFGTEPISLQSSAVAVPQNGALAYDAVVRLAEPTTFLQVRLRVRRPSGRLLYQKTFVRSDVAAGTQTFSFRRALSDLELRPAVYPVELTVDAEGTPRRSWAAEGSLRVFDSDAAALPLAILVKVSSAPSTDPERRFVTDPAHETRVRDEVIRMADAIVSMPPLRLSLAISPQSLEEWQLIAGGYEFAGAEGIRRVSADDPTPRSYAKATEKLKAALATGRLELLNVPYADPDVAGLALVGRLDDLGVHYERGISTYFAALEVTPSAGTFTARACLTAAGAREAAANGIRYALVSQRYARSAGETSPAGVFAASGVSLAVLVPDPEISRLIAAGDPVAVTDALFERAIESEEGSPAALPLVIDVGPGRAASINALVRGLEDALGEPWTTFNLAGELARTPEETPLKLVSRASVGANTPEDWWTSVAGARVRAGALAAALSPESRDAENAVMNSLIAEDAYWSGPDGLWALADRARAFASAADRSARSVFDKVTVTAQDVTLSGASGSVPVSIANESGASLTVVLRSSPTGIQLRGPSVRKVTLLPAENYFTVPVDLRSAVGGTLKLEVDSGSVTIASRTVRVRASYLDRLAIIGAIALLLGGMLVYIQRRVRRADAAVGGG